MHGLEKGVPIVARAILDERMAETFEQPHRLMHRLFAFGVNLGS